MRVGLFAASCWLLLASSGFAQDWAKAMFDHTFHDFGVVARGSNVEHRFTFKNIYLENAQISSVRSSCGCTNAHSTKQSLKTYETAEIVAVLDTKQFLGHKEATITVTFSQPFSAEVQLRVTSFIRGDVVCEPGAVHFGTVVQGNRAPVQVLVTYAGRDDWKITDVQSNNPYLAATIREVSRFQGKVTYDLGIILTEKAPLGYIKDFVLVATNDLASQTSRLTLPVDGNVIPPPTAVTAGPSPLLFGAVDAGQAVTRNLVVRGKSPFHILEITGPDSRFRFQYPSEAKVVHLVPATLTAGVTPGLITGKIRIRTDVPGNEWLEVAVDGRVTAAPSGSVSPRSPGSTPATSSDSKTVAPPKTSPVVPVNPSKRSF